MATDQKRRKHDEIVVAAAEKTLGNWEWLQTLDEIRRAAESMFKGLQE